MTPKDFLLLGSCSNSFFRINHVGEQGDIIDFKKRRPRDKDRRTREGINKGTVLGEVITLVGNESPYICVVASRGGE